MSLQDELTLFETEQPIMKITEEWGDGVLVTFPVSETYNGGIEIKGKLYSGFRVPDPIVPDGCTLVGIGIGLERNCRPPVATVLMKRTDGTKLTMHVARRLNGCR